jgi:uncharacterized protein YutD
MISYIKTKNENFASDNIFIFEYSLGNDNVEYRFDINIHNYGYEIIGIKNKSDEEIYESDRLDVIEEQSDFVTESTSLQSLIKLIHLDNQMFTDEKINTTKKYIDEFCTKWDLIHETSV